MCNVFYWAGIQGNEALLKKHRVTIDKIWSGNGRAVNFKKLKGHNVYSARVNHSDRLLFTTIEVEGKHYLLLLEEVLNHDYQKSKFLKSSTLSNFLELKGEVLKQKIIKEEEHFEDLDALPVELARVEEEAIGRPLEYYNYNFIELTTTQRAVVRVKLPLVLGGTAGSGKTIIAIYSFHQHHLDVLTNNPEVAEANPAVAAANPAEAAPREPYIYVTQSKELKESAQRQWNEAYPDLDGMVRCMTYEELAKTIDNELQDQTKVGSEYFKLWLDYYWGVLNNLNKTKKSLNSLFLESSEKFVEEEDLFYEELRIASAYKKNEYLSLGEKQSLVDKKHREAFWSLYKAYKLDLVTSKRYDLSIYRIKGKKNYPLTIVDEAQDLSHGQLRSLHGLGPNIVYCTDSLQTLEDRLSRKPFLKQLRGPDKELISYYELVGSHRCGSRILKGASELISLRNEVTGGTSDKDEPCSVERAKEAAPKEGAVTWLTAEEKTALEKEEKGADFAIITLQEYVEEAKKRYKTDAVYTVEKIKGLEFKRILAYRLFDGDNEIGKEANQILSTKSPSEHDIKHRAKAKDRDKACFGPYFHHLYTAFTRAKDQLLIDQKITHHNEELLTRLKTRLQPILTELNLTSIAGDNTKEKWYELAKQLLRQDDEDGVAQAVKILEERLNYTPAQIEAQIETFKPKPAAPFADATDKAKPKAPEALASRSAQGKKADLDKKNTTNAPAAKQAPLPLPKENTTIIFFNEIKQKNTATIEKLLKNKRTSIDNAVRRLSKNKRIRTAEVDNENSVDRVDNQNNQDGVIKVLEEHGINSTHIRALFFDAIKEGNAETVRWLLENKCIDSNSTDDKGCSACLIAAYNNQATMIKILANYGAHFDDAIPAFIAAEQNYDQVNRELGKLRAAKYNRKYKPYDIVKFFRAIHAGNTEYAEYSLENKLVDIHVTDQRGFSASLVAACENKPQIIALLAKRGEKFDDISPAIVAACYGYTEIIRELVKHKVDFNQFIKTDGQPPLFVAAENGHKEVVAVLAEQPGVDLNQADYENATPLFLAAQNGYSSIIHELGKYKDRVDFDQADIDSVTPAMIAVEKKNLNVITALAKYGADFNKTNSKGEGPAIKAVRKGRADIIATLAKHNTNFNQQDAKGRTPAHIAVKHKKIKALAELAKQGVDFNITDFKGKTAVFLAAEMGNMEAIQEFIKAKVDFNFPLITSAQNLREWASNQSVVLSRVNNFINELEKQEKDLNALTVLPDKIASIAGYEEVAKKIRSTQPQVSQENFSTFSKAILQGEIEVVKSLLQERLVHVHVTTVKRWSAVLVAAQFDNAEVIALLAKYGANLKDIQVALVAAKYGSLKVIQELVKQGVNFNGCSKKGITPAIMAAQNGQLAVIVELAKLGVNFNQTTNVGETPAFYAAFIGNVEILAELAKTPDTNFDAARTTDNSTPALLAASKGFTTVIAELAKHGVDFKKANNKGLTPALVAARCGFHEVIAELAKHDGGLEKPDNAGVTPAIIAVYYKHHQVIAELAKHKASLDIPNVQGKSAAFIAALNGDEKIIDVIINAGTEFNIVHVVSTEELIAWSSKDNETFKRLKKFIDENTKDGKTPSTISLFPHEIASIAGYEKIAEKLELIQSNAVKRKQIAETPPCYSIDAVNSSAFFNGMNQQKEETKALMDDNSFIP